MPTATATMTHNDENGRAAFRSVVLPSKSSSVVGSTVGVRNDVVVGGGVIGATTAATTITLRTLYNRATRSFLHRDVKLTCQLLETAFSIIQPPNPTPSSSKSITNSNSSLQLQEISTDEKRKWDILRITLESTVYASTLTPIEQSSLPESLRLVLQETPNDLVKGFYERSLELFSTSRMNDVGVVTQNGSTSGSGMDGYSRHGDVAFFPTQVLITLVLASLKVGCPDFGRIMIEDWLSKREQPSSSSYGERSGIEVDGEDGDGDGYAKVLEIYCLHVLPKLSQWEYAVEFLEYESELGVRNRERLKAQLKSAYTNYLTSLRKSSSSSTTTTTSSSHSESSTPRPHSPATSTSSSSSSLSTTSTHTIVPTHRQGVNGYSNMNGHGYSRSHSRSSSSGSSTKSDVTARARPNGTKMNGSNDEIGGSKLTNMNGNGNNIRSRSKSKARAKARTASSGSGNGIGNGNGQLRSKSKSKSNGNVHVGAQMLNGHGLGQGLGGGGGIGNSTSSSSSGSAMTRSKLSNLELVKVVIKPYLTKGKLLMAFLVFVVLPVLSLVVRRRRRKSGGVSIINTTMNSEVSNVELVRRRLGGVEAGLVGKAWNEVVRVVLDTVKMAGSGLV